ncbi:hypothetical protein V5740_10165 [Croceibacterium sp. TMG7-5b_MA50]|uniref:sodium:solute symporter family protein n=1 Tax=Croceibacterium sp. TMG7-5b_MA50 TaxID=3121290 RepID=UPI003221B03E
MTLAVFLAIMALSLLLALWSRWGHGQQGARAFFTAHGQFGAVLFFFLSVGETYSIASMLGFPGGVYAGGDAFVLWFFGYILLACTCIFFAGPWIWRAGRLYGSATIPDFFRDHWNSRSLELLVAITSIILLLPIGTMQFTGLRLVLGGLAPDAAPLLLTGGAGLLCFAYVVIAGLRASAFVAVLKDLLMMGSILLVGGLAIADWQAVPALAQPAAAPVATPPDMVFAISTILLQAVGFTMIPQNWAFMFSARDPQAIRRAQIVAPLYTLMFPLLMATATYAQGHGIVPAQADYVFLAVAQVLLHPAAVGLVMAAVALSGLVILASVCLAIGPLVTRNLVPGLPGDAQQRWSRWVVAAFLLLSLLSAESGGTLMARLNNLFYFGVVQTLPGFVAALLLPRVPVAAIVGGIVAGDACVLALWLGEVPVGGLNLGVIGLAVNVTVLAGVTAWRPRAGGRSVVAALKDAA